MVYVTCFSIFKACSVYILMICCISEEFVRTRWRSLRDRYMREKRKQITKSGQAATQYGTWELMSHMEFLSDSTKPRQ